MNAIILCGGLSTRLGDITKDVSKILLEIRGKATLFVLALAVDVSRVYAGGYYPRDVLGGIVFAFGVMWATSKLFGNLI